MASIGTFLFLFVVIACISAASSENSFVSIKCKAENVGLFGHQSMLECSLHSSAEVSDFNVRVMSWSRKGQKPILLYNGGKWNTTPGYKVTALSWNKNNSNISLLITNTTVADDGEYTCLVITDSGDSEGSTSLRVKAEYSPPKVHSVPEKIIEDQDSTLICESSGGYPKGKLRWFDMDRQEWTASSQMEVKQTENGLFQLSSKLSLLRGSTYSTYTCVVFNASGSKGDEVTFELPLSFGQQGNKETSPAHVAAPLVVIGSLVVGLLLVLLVRRRRQSQLARRQSTRPLMNNHHEIPVPVYDVEKGDNEMIDKQCKHSLE